MTGEGVSVDVHLQLTTNQPRENRYYCSRCRGLASTPSPVVDLQGLFGLEKGDNKDISEDKEVPSQEKEQNNI